MSQSHYSFMLGVYRKVMADVTPEEQRLLVLREYATDELIDELTRRILARLKAQTQTA